LEYKTIAVEKKENFTPFIIKNNIINNININPPIEIKNAKLILGDKMVILNNLNLKVEAGKKCAIIGPSGSGKHSVFNLILNLAENANSK